LELVAGRIVVGIDGSEDSAGALRWAVAEADLRGADVEAVHAWTLMPVAAPPDAGLVPLAWTESSEVLDASQRAAERVAHDELTAVLGAEHRVRLSVVLGEPAAALLEAAEDAELLVVGNRGRGSFAQTLFGSTSAKVSDRASCPVVIVRSPGND
jgi:nucleotide-binding universal stress UspA family protein